nr:MAG TPA: hypothetical protein [Caudoviricetes sp.]
MVLMLLFMDWVLLLTPIVMLMMALELAQPRPRR